MLDKPNTSLKSLQSSYRNCTIGIVSTNRNTDNKNCFGQPSPFMIIICQYKHGLGAHKDRRGSFMLKNVPIIIRPVINIKLALKLCHFDILSNTGWLQQLNWRHGPAIFFTQQTICIMIYLLINCIHKFA